MRKRKGVSIQATRAVDGQKSEGHSVKAVYQIEGSENPDDDTLKEMVMEGARKVLVGFF